MSSPAPWRGWPTRSLVGEMSDDLREQFLSLGSRRTFARGDVLIAEDDRTTDVFVIISGFVRVVNHTASGERAIMAIRTRGDVVGEFAALDGKPRTSSGIAACRTVVHVVDAPLFRAFAASNPSVGAAVSRSVIAKLRTATRYRVETGQASVLTRVARVLEHLAESYGRRVSRGVLLDIPLPQQDLAALVATSATGVARAYRDLRRAGAIEVAYRQVLVTDLAVLERYTAAGSARP